MSLLSPQIPIEVLFQLSREEITKYSQSLRRQASFWTTASKEGGYYLRSTAYPRKHLPQATRSYFSKKLKTLGVKSEDVDELRRGAIDKLVKKHSKLLYPDDPKKVNVWLILLEVCKERFPYVFPQRCTCEESDEEEESFSIEPDSPSESGSELESESSSDS